MENYLNDFKEFKNLPKTEAFNLLGKAFRETINTTDYFERGKIMNKDKKIKKLKAQLKAANGKNLFVISELDKANEAYGHYMNVAQQSTTEIGELKQYVGDLIKDNEISTRDLRFVREKQQRAESKLNKSRILLMNLYDFSQRTKEQTGITPLIMMVEEIAKEGVEARREFAARKR